MIESFGEFRVSNDALSDADELRLRMDDEGYVFFRGLLDPDRLRTLRRDMLEVIAANGWLVPGTDPMDGIADPDKRCTEGDLGYVDVYHQVYRLESFHRSGHWPARPRHASRPSRSRAGPASPAAGSTSGSS